jgi:hypothetical protein
MEINLAAKGTATADFAFTAATASDVPRSDSLRIMPAVEFPMMSGH